jgi:hypothetical protein
LLIDPSSWEDAQLSGWRWVQNVELGSPDLAAFVSEFGPDRVLISLGFDPATFSPSPLTEFNHLGLYVKDVDELIDGLEEDMLNWDFGHVMDASESE